MNVLEQECLIAVIRVFFLVCFRGPKWFHTLTSTKAKIIRRRVRMYMCRVLEIVKI